MDVIHDTHARSCRVTERLTCRVSYPSFKEDFFEELSKSPEWACCKRLMRALALCKSYYPYVDLDKLVEGFPELKAGGSQFEKADYTQVFKSVRHYGTKIADEVNLCVF